MDYDFPSIPPVVLETLIQCPYCHNRCHEPKRLHCFHTLCAQCCPRDLRCPICGSRDPDIARSEGLPKDRLVADLIELIDTAQPSLPVKNPALLTLDETTQTEPCIQRTSCSGTDIDFEEYFIRNQPWSLSIDLVWAFIGSFLGYNISKSLQMHRALHGHELNISFLGTIIGAGLGPICLKAFEDSSQFVYKAPNSMLNQGKCLALMALILLQAIDILKSGWWRIFRIIGGAKLGLLTVYPSYSEGVPPRSYNKPICFSAIAGALSGVNAEDFLKLTVLLKFWKLPGLLLNILSAVDQMPIVFVPVLAIPACLGAYFSPFLIGLAVYYISYFIRHNYRVLGILLLFSIVVFITDGHL